MVTDLTRLSDGTYGRELGRVSPEGNIYGTTRWVRDVLRNFWWNGSDWLEIGEDIGQSSTVQLLPTTPQEPDTVWRCLDRYEEDKARYLWKYFFWDAESQTWQPILWHWTVDSVQELPNNPWFRGQAHEVKEPDVQAMWDGYTWRRIRISSLEDDLGIISTLDMYGGTLRGLSPEVELIYISPTELTLKPINSDFEYVTINGVVVDSSKRTSVYSFSPVLSWWDETESFSTSLIQHSTPTHNQEYWVYLANKDDAFNLPTYDFRGKLFCSESTPFNNRLGKLGTAAYNAVLIGKCQTAIPNNETDRVEFLYELDVSIISKAADLKETFREFSDFDVSYVDENTLRLQRIYATMGQIYIGGTLYYLGESIDLTINDTRIIATEDGLLEFDYTDISQNQLYYVYIASNSDIYNDNEINTEHNRPWHAEDDGAGDGLTGPYYANKDLRLKMFLSTKVPEEGRLAETWRGYFTRHIGQVVTEGTGRFVFSSSISAIRQAMLNPSYFDGLAEISIVSVSNTEFMVVRKRGTSGIVMVNGVGIPTYDSSDMLSHRVRIDSDVYDYQQSQQSGFLIANGDVVGDYISSDVHLYLANNRDDLWGDLAGRTFACLSPPVGGYLGQNFPGNNARFIATARPSAGEKGVDIVTDGYFISSNGWVTTGWTVSSTEKTCAHNTGNTKALSQVSMPPITPGKTYEISFSVISASSGSITPQIGDTNGTAITTSGSFKQYIRATGTGLLKFVPTSTANHVIDNVTCRPIDAATFSGAFISDSILGSSVSMDDTIVSSTQTWSSARIMEEVVSWFGQSGLNSIWNTEKAYGTQLILEYVNTQTLRIRALNTTTTVVFPDLTVRNIDTTGTTLTVSGAPGVMHYVYLDANDFYVSTSPPSDVYAKLKTRGTTAILVGYLCMTATNRMSGNWNVYSASNNPTQVWKSNVTVPTTSISLPGLVVVDGSTMVERTGITNALYSTPYPTITASTSAAIAGVGSAYLTIGAAVGGCSCRATCYWVCNGGGLGGGTRANVTSSVPVNSLLPEGIYNQFILTHSETDRWCSGFLICMNNGHWEYTRPNDCSLSYPNVSGEYIVTRRGI